VAYGQYDAENIVTLSLLSVNPAYVFPTLGAKNSDAPLVELPTSFKNFIPYYIPLLTGFFNKEDY